MKILFYLHRYPAVGGIEQVTTVLANELERRGYAVEIVSHVEQTNQSAFCHLRCGINRISMPEPCLFSRRNRRFLKNEIDRFRPDIIVFQDSYAQIERNLFYEGMNVPVIVCEHNSPFVVYESPNRGCGMVRFVLESCFFCFIKYMKYLRDCKRRRFLYARSARYVLLSNQFFGEFRAVAHLSDSRKLRSIPNPILPLGRSCDCSKENICLFVGSVDARKGCDTLIDVWSDICKSYPQWKLVIVGEGALLHVLKQKVMSDGIPNIKFEGRKIDPSPYYQVAKIFIFPSRREGWGLVLLEAMQHGCVPIAFNSYASLGDIIIDGENGYSVPAFDIRLYRDRLRDLMENDDLRIKMSRNAKAFVSRYSVDSVMCKWIALLNEIVKGD